MILEALYFQSVYFDSCFLRKFPEICATSAQNKSCNVATLKTTCLIYHATKSYYFFSQQEKGWVMLIFESCLGQNELERNVIKKRHESRLQFKIN